MELDTAKTLLFWPPLFENLAFLLTPFKNVHCPMATDLRYFGVHLRMHRLIRTLSHFRVR